MKGTITAVSIALAGFSVSCMTGASDVESDQQNGMHLNGMHLNGMHLNGMHLNGTTLGGIYINATTKSGVALSGTRLGRTQVHDVSLHATELTGYTWERSSWGWSYKDWKAGTDFIGARLSAITESATEVSLHIEDMHWNSGLGLYLYEITAVTGDEKGLLCGKKAKNLAIPLNGRWNQDQGYFGAGGKIPGADGITIGCVDLGAIAKCVQLGYKPWQSYHHDMAHQSCVRMIRADYCGDGRSWTRDGTPIDVEDMIPEQLFANFGSGTAEAKKWGFEATWGPNGARCIENFRYDEFNPYTNTSIAAELKNRSCPNLPRAVDNSRATKLLGRGQGSASGTNLCGWESPKTCDPSVQTCPDQGSGDIQDHTPANAKQWCSGSAGCIEW